MGASRNSSLRLLPNLADYAGARSRQLGLPLATYIGVLLWNYSITPMKLKQEPAAAAFARVHVPCYIRLQVWGVTREALKKSTLSRNSLIEALIAEDKRGPQGFLIIKARQQ